MEAAFFDLDRTVIARASLAAYGPVLRKEGYLSVPMALRAAWGQVVYRFFGADDEAIDRARRTALRLAAGWEQEGLRRIARDHLAEVIEPIVYDEALDLIDQHRAEGRLIVLVSAAPVEIVEPLATHLGIDEFVATTPEIDPEGRYTGEIEFSAHGRGKAEAMSRLAQDRDIDLAASWAYSDSVSDLPMLEAVGHPVAVNPDRQLRRVAEEREWPVLEFDRPVALGERVPLDRRWGAVTALTFALALLLWAGVRRARRGSRTAMATEAGIRSSGPS
jgi:HAD superfamily hydrolase (TIGR01490 family)